MLKRVQVGFSTAGCCPSLFISSDASLGQSIATRALSPEHAKKPLAVYSGFIGNQSLYPLEQSLVHLLEQDGDPGFYISQHGGTLLSLGDERFRGQLSESELLHAKTMIKPQTSMEDFLHWCKIHARSFFSVDEWLRVLQHYSYSCGMRFHGNMLSLQAGIPSVCITIDSRTEELCQSCLVPSMTAFEFSHVTREVLHRVFRVRFNPDEFDVNRVMMARKLMSFLLANNVSPSLHLQTIATGQTASSALVEVDKRAPALV